MKFSSFVARRTVETSLRDVRRILRGVLFLLPPTPPFKLSRKYVSGADVVAHARFPETFMLQHELSELAVIRKRVRFFVGMLQHIQARSPGVATWSFFNMHTKTKNSPTTRDFFELSKSRNAIEFNR